MQEVVAFSLIYSKERNKVCDIIHRKWFIEFIQKVGTFHMCSDIEDSTVRDFKTRFYPNDNDYKRSWQRINDAMKTLLQEGLVKFTQIPGRIGQPGVRCWTKV